MRHTYIAPDRRATAVFVAAYSVQFATDGFAPWVAVLSQEQRVVGWGGLNCGSFTRSHPRRSLQRSLGRSPCCARPSIREVVALDSCPVQQLFKTRERGIGSAAPPRGGAAPLLRHGDATNSRHDFELCARDVAGEDTRILDGDYRIRVSVEDQCRLADLRQAVARVELLDRFVLSDQRVEWGVASS